MPFLSLKGFLVKKGKKRILYVQTHLSLRSTFLILFFHERRKKQDAESVYATFFIYIFCCDYFFPNKTKRILLLKMRCFAWLSCVSYFAMMVAINAKSCCTLADKPVVV